VRERRTSTTISHQKTQGGNYSVGECITHLVSFLRRQTPMCDIVVRNCIESLPNTHFPREGRNSTAIAHEKTEGGIHCVGECITHSVSVLRSKTPDCDTHNL
jgi:hypothetical protein